MNPYESPKCVDIKRSRLSLKWKACMLTFVILIAFNIGLYKQTENTVVYTYLNPVGRVAWFFTGPTGWAAEMKAEQ